MLLLAEQQDPENCRSANFTSVPSKVVDKILMKTISKHIKFKKVIWNSHMDLQKGNHAWPTWWPSTVTRLDCGGRVVDVVYLNFSKASDSVSASHNIPPRCLFHFLW